MLPGSTSPNSAAGPVSNHPPDRTVTEGTLVAAQNKAQNKTTAGDGDVGAFVDSIEDPVRQAEARTLTSVMSEVTGQRPVMWGTAIVGFGQRHYRYESGREGDSFRVGFAPRKAQSVVYVSGDFADYADLLPRLGRHSIGKSCLYLKRVDEADPAALRELVDRSFRYVSPVDTD